MKNFRFKISLAAAAFVIGIAAAFSSKAVTANTAWFYLDGAGQPVERIQGQPQCAMSQNDCAQLFQVDASGHPTQAIGQPLKGDRQ